MKRLLIILSVLILVPSAFAADSDLVEKAKAEGQVSFYANMTAIQPIMDVFNAQTGLKGKYTRISTSKFLATVLTEYQAGKLMARGQKIADAIMTTRRDEWWFKNSVDKQK